MRPYTFELMSIALQMLSEDNEENGLLCLRNSFKLHKQSFQCAILQLCICRLLPKELMRHLLKS